MGVGKVPVELKYIENGKSTSCFNDVYSARHKEMALCLQDYTINLI